MSVEETRAHRIVKEAVRDVLNEKKGAAMDATGAELDAEIGGQKLKYSGPVNTLVTVLGFVVTCLIGWVLFTHSAETKEASNALVSALKDQTQALRENNCLQTYRGPEEQKQSFCKQVTR